MPINLISVRNDMKRRYEDIKIMESILERNPKVDSQLILKSSLMLMIYNMVEGTMSNLLMEYFDCIHTRNITINSLSSEFQRTIMSYFHKKENHDDYIVDTVFDLSYSRIKKSLNLFSGNLDSRSIKKVCKKVGVNLTDDIKEPVLLIVKNNRNKLAHGETKFNNTCQDITLNEIEEISNKTQKYLIKVIDKYEESLNTLYNM